MKHISITGDLGSGKSTVAKIICGQGVFEYFSTGSLQRKLAAEKGMNTLEMNYFSETTQAIDDYIDGYLKGIEKDKESPSRYVLDSRLAWHFVPSSFKVFLTVRPEVAASRVLSDKERSNEGNADDLEEQQKNLLERQEVESRRFKKLYNVIYRDLSNYDLVIDTSELSPAEVAEQILAAAEPFDEEAIRQIQTHGQEVERVERQLISFRKGFPYLELAGSATVGNGILRFDETGQQELLRSWDDYLRQEGRKSVKFVPASGAASRMFKDLFAFLDSDSDEPRSDFEKNFCHHCQCFAFSPELDEVCRRNEGKSLKALAEEGQYKTIVRNLLLEQGLHYGSLPKGLLTFHTYADGNRKAVTEHLVEGALYACDVHHKVYIHFTVSPEHKALFQQEIARVQADIEKKYGVSFEISFSEQKASTDTLAADKDNRPFLDHGKLLFRPGGHGALIENLNDMDADIVFIKNIDNVVPDRLKDSTVLYKKVLAGLLVRLQAQCFDYLRKLENAEYTHEELIAMVQFLQQKLNVRHPDLKLMEDSELVLYLMKKLNRPMRVCGMVRNQGEPGGGPFLAYNADGSTSLQILESSQIDKNDPAKKAMFKNGTHFNPVDLVCAVRNYQGQKFNLPDYVDPQTGFISSKSKNGLELKALELPGLWNGAMSDWNTVFVEVPIETFNPVKTVNDLLREQHC